MKKSPKCFNSKSASVFSFLAIAGLITTTVLAIKDTPKAIQIMESDDFKYGSTANKTKMIAKNYIPSLISGAATIFCITSANSIHVKKENVLIGTVATYTGLLERYKNSIKSTFNCDELSSLNANIAEDVYKNNNSIPKKFNKNEQLYYESYSQRFFWSTPNDVITAMYKFNRNFLLAYGERSISEFFDFLGLDEKENSKYESIGYSAYHMEVSGLRPWIDWILRKKTLKDGTQYTSIDFVWEPEFEYWNDDE